MNISIIIPLYNGHEYLKQCIDSILNQTYKYFEVIIGINGHGIDSEIYKYAIQFKKDNIHVIELLTVGKPESLNEMIKYCKYDIICLLDVDDYWLPTKLEEQINIWKLNKYDVIGTFTQYYGDSNSVPKIEPKEIDNRIFFIYNTIINSSMMIKKNLCYWNNIDVEDYDLWLRLVYDGKKMYNVPKILCMHNISKNTYFNNINNQYVPNLIQSHKMKYETYITVVTCYFKIKSKYSDEKYKIWIKMFLNIPMNIIIFTDLESFEFIKECRNKYLNKTKIIVIKLNEFEMYKHIDYFNYSYTIDPEKTIHSPELYLIWAEKPYFVKKSIELNPFNSKWFFWCDIGCCRNPQYANMYLTFPNWISILNYETNKIIYSKIQDFLASDNIKYENGILKLYTMNLSPIYLTRIQGGFFAVHETMISKLIELYNTTFNLFKNNKIFGGKDQYIMYTMLLYNPEYFKIIDARETKIDDVWYSFLNRFK